MGANEFEEGIVNQWLDFANIEMCQNGGFSLMNKYTYGFIQENKEELKKIREQMDYPL